MAAVLLIHDFLFLFLWNMSMFSPIFNLGELSYIFFFHAKFNASASIDV